MHAAIYSRKSRYTGKGESIENQIELCRQYITAHYGQDTAEEALIYEDEGFSGGNLERPRFKQMMADARDRKINAIIVYRLDRISRNIGDFAKLIEELASLGVAFISIKEQFDTSSPMGRAMMYIASVFSQLERETIAERIRDNMHELAKSGRWLGGTTPTGYKSVAEDKITVDGNTKRLCRLELLPDEAMVVDVIYRKFLDTHSLTQTDTFLLRNDYRTKTGRRFTRFAIKNILTNPVYMTADHEAYQYFVDRNADMFTGAEGFDGMCGVMAYNRTLQKAGQTHRIKPVSEWIIAVGKHQGIIHAADWIRVQGLLRENKAKGHRKTRGNQALLAGLVVCGKCGGHMRVKAHNRMNANGERGHSYLCTMKERSKLNKCNIKNLGGNALDNAVWSAISDLCSGSSDYELKLSRELEKYKKSLPEDGEGRVELERLRHLIDENAREIQALISSLKNASGVVEGYIMQRIEELHTIGEGYRQCIKEIDQRILGDASSGSDIDGLAQGLCSFVHIAQDMGIEQRREAAREAVERIIWDGEDAHVYFKGCEPLCEDSK